MCNVCRSLFVLLSIFICLRYLQILLSFSNEVAKWFNFLPLLLMSFSLLRVVDGVVAMASHYPPCVYIICHYYPCMPHVIFRDNFRFCFRLNLCDWLHWLTVVIIIWQNCTAFSLIKFSSWIPEFHIDLIIKESYLSYLIHSILIWNLMILPCN